ncbi:hypothetical protein UXO56_10595 [Enterobacter ludwigii]
MSEVTDLVVIEKQNAMAIFTTKEQLDPIIEAIEKEARSLVPDVSTRKGRDAIASMAHKVARSNIVNALTSNTSLTREQAIEVLTALKDDLIPCAKIHY